jgi:outer membrane protein TolC
VPASLSLVASLGILLGGPPVDVGEPPPAPATTQAGPALTVEYELPFAAEPRALSQVLKAALDDNMDLATAVIDVDVSEAAILSAHGAYDVLITAGGAGSWSKSTPRGSAFIFNTGSRTLSGYLGVGRQLETGGRFDVRFDVNRTLSNQPISFFSPSLGSTTLASYLLNPSISLTHPLLRGLGVKVNRIPIERAELAATQAEAQAQVTAENTVRDLVSAYWDLLFAHRDLENKHRSKVLAEQQLRRTQAQVDAGRLAPVDVKAVQQALASRENEVLIAENTLLDRSLTVRTLSGETLEDHRMLGVLPTTDPVGLDGAAIDLDASVEAALEQNPQIRQLKLALSSRRLDELEAANQRLVQLDFTGRFAPQGRSVDTAADPQTGAASQRGGWGEAFRNFINDDVAANGLFSEFTLSGQLDLTWAVQNRAARGNHARLVAESRKAEINLTAVRQTVIASVVRAANALRSAEARVRVAESSVSLAQDNLAAEEARYEHGRSTDYDVLQRIDELATAESTALSAHIEVLKAKVQLDALTGTVLPAYGLALRRG